MTKGVLAGTFWGLVVGVTGLTIASISAPQPAGNTPPSPPLVDAPQAAEASSETPAPPAAAEALEGTEAADAPAVAAPSDGATSLVADTTPADQPGGLTLESTPQPPEIGSSPELAATVEDPVLPSPQSVAPQVPATEGDLVVSTAPPEPIVVETPEEVVVAEDVPEAPARPAEPATVVEVVPEVTTQEVAPVTPVDVPVAAPEQPVAVAPAAPISSDDAPEPVTVAPPAPAEVATTTEPDVPVSAAPETTIAGTVPEAEVAAPAAPAAEPATDVVTAADPPPAIVPTEEAVPAAPAEPAPPPPPQETAQDVAAEGAAPAPAEPAAPVAPETGAPPVVSLSPEGGSRLPGGGSGVKVNRIGVSTPEASTDVAETTDDPAAVDDSADGPALDRFAAEFTLDAPDQPLMGIVLIDDAGFAAAPRALAELPFTVTVVVDPLADGAGDRAAAYREVGAEVALSSPLPEGARPADVEVAMEAALAVVPQAVVLFDDGGGSLGRDRAVRDQALARLSADGRGYVSAAQGLSNGIRVAEAADVPAAAIFRDLDGAGQDAAAIRRFLDQAAFRARQQGNVVLLARVRPETLSALMAWGDASRADQVAFAPVSAVLGTQ